MSQRHSDGEQQPWTCVKAMCGGYVGTSFVRATLDDVIPHRGDRRPEKAR
jgi:hypothetical protein